MNRQSIQRLAGIVLACLLFYRFSVNLAFLAWHLVKLERSSSGGAGSDIRFYGANCVVIGTALWVVFLNAEVLGRYLVLDRLNSAEALLCALLRIMMCYYIIMDVEWICSRVAQDLTRVAQVSMLYLVPIIFGGAWILVDILVFAIAPRLCEFLLRHAELSFQRRGA